jgi:hypothetical protein
MPEAAIELARWTRPYCVEAAQVHVERILLVEFKWIVRLGSQVIAHHFKACTV